MSVYNPDELNPPTWMNTEFFAKVISHHEEGQCVLICNCDIQPACMKGDHFGSVMFRAKIEYKFDENEASRNISLILKTIPDAEGGKRDLLMNSPLFDTEMNMYGKIIPEFERILAEHGDNTKFGPKMIYSASEPVSVIVLEDLCELGYDALRFRYPDETELKMIYEKLGKFHALSYKLAQTEHNNIYTNFQNGMFSLSMAIRTDIIANGTKRFIEMLSAHDELKQYVPKFKLLEENIFDDCKQLYRSYHLGVKDEIFVLNHGDFHIKNMMFKYAENSNLVDLVFVDYQVSVFAPSTVDVLYSLTTILNPEVRIHKRNEFLHYYFEHFIATLKLIGYNGKYPSYSDLKISMLRHKRFAVFLIATFLPLAHALFAFRETDQLKESNISEVFDNPDVSTMFYKNPQLIEDLRELLPSLLHDGFLD